MRQAEDRQHRRRQRERMLALEPLAIRRDALLIPGGFSSEEGHGLSMEIIDLNALPVLLVARAELFVQRMNLVFIVPFRIVQRDAQADVVTVIDDIPRRAGGLARPDMP